MWMESYNLVWLGVVRALAHGVHPWARCSGDRRYSNMLLAACPVAGTESHILLKARSDLG